MSSAKSRMTSLSDGAPLDSDLVKLIKTKVNGENNVFLARQGRAGDNRDADHCLITV